MKTFSFYIFHFFVDFDTFAKIIQKIQTQIKSLDVLICSSQNCQNNNCESMAMRFICVKITHVVIICILILPIDELHFSIPSVKDFFFCFVLLFIFLPLFAHGCFSTQQKDKIILNSFSSWDATLLPTWPLVSFLFQATKKSKFRPRAEKNWLSSISQNP